MFSPSWLSECSSPTSQIQGATSSQARPSHSSKPDEEVSLSWGYKIPTRDHVSLNATVYKPKRIKTKLPVIFTLTPYVADTYHDRAFYFARNGYVFVLVDLRGRGNSEGEFSPFTNDGLDGYDIVEHLARQSWCNGKVAMWGGSYAGYDQWATLKESPPHLETIVPAASAGPGIDAPSLNGIWFPYMMQWLTLTSGVAYNGKIFEDNKFWIDKFQELYKNQVPFRDLDRVVGNPSKQFEEWLKYGPGDSYWVQKRPTPEQYRRIDIPILTITGQYDGDQPGAMHYYRMHMRHGTPRSRAQHHLIIGPWDHPGTRTPKNEFGGLKFGEASVLDLNKLHKEWYDWTLKNGKRPSFLKKRVAIYVAGSEAWKYADTLEKASPAKWKLYLSSANGNDAFHSGSLEEKAHSSPPDRYVYNPLDVSRSELDREEVKDYLTDERYALNLFGSGLVYHTQPVRQMREITGYAKLTLYVSMDVPDTDFEASVYEIKPSGKSIFLTSEIMRARYRESLDQEKLVEPGRINKYEFNKFYYTSRRIEKLSRIRLVVQPPNSIFWQKNYNSGGEVASESRKNARTANVTVHHDTRYSSVLELPVATRAG
jgi:putative CocE/NonD family hydrolase